MPPFVVRGASSPSAVFLGPGENQSISRDTLLPPPTSVPSGAFAAMADEAEARAEALTNEQTRKREKEKFHVRPSARRMLCSIAEHNWGSPLTPFPYFSSPFPPRLWKTTALPPLLFLPSSPRYPPHYIRSDEGGDITFESRVAEAPRAKSVVGRPLLPFSLPIRLPSCLLH